MMRALAVVCVLVLMLGSAFFLTRGHSRFEAPRPSAGMAKQPDAPAGEPRIAKREPNSRSRDSNLVKDATVRAGSEAEQREKMANAEADFREIVARNIALDYAAFLAGRSLSPEKKDLILKALADQFSAASSDEKEQYDELLKQLLGEELFAQLATYRERLPVEKQIEAGVAALKSAVPAVGASEEAKVRHALESIPPINPLAIEVVRQAQISDADVQRVFASYERFFDDAFATVDVPASTRSALRDWYLRQQIGVQMNVLRTQQAILGSKSGG